MYTNIPISALTDNALDVLEFVLKSGRRFDSNPVLDENINDIYKERVRRKEARLKGETY